MPDGQHYADYIYRPALWEKVEYPCRTRIEAPQSCDPHIDVGYGARITAVGDVWIAGERKLNGYILGCECAFHFLTLSIFALAGDPIGL